MRILTITSSYPKFASDTTAPFIESITQELAARGHLVTVVLPQRDDLSPRSIEGVRFLPYRYAPVRSLQVFGYAEALRADVALRGATILVTPLAALSGVRALRREIASGAYDVVHAHWVVPSGAMAAWALGASSGLPLVVSLHGSDVFLAEKSRIVRSGARRAFRRAAAVTACSQDLADRSRGIGASSPPEVIPYGVDTELFRPAGARGQSLRCSLGIGASEAVVLAVGRLVHKKGFEYLVDAAAELAKRGRPVRLLIAGKGDLEPLLAARAREAGLEGVRLLGNVERSDLPAYYSMADVVAVPSVRDPAGNVDGLPNVLLEAMAAEKAIVATEVAGIPMALRKGEEGMLVPEKDVSELANALDKLSRSKELRSELGRRARQRALEDYGWKRAGERFESVLRSVT